jgi:hypothetical protein
MNEAPYHKDVWGNGDMAPPFLRSCQLCRYSRTSQNFMEPKGSLPCSQEPSIGPYPEPDQSSPYNAILSVRPIKQTRITKWWTEEKKIRDSTVGIVNWLRDGRPGVRSSSPGRVKNFLFSMPSRSALGPIHLLYKGYRRIKRPVREADHSPISAEVTKM